MPHFMIRTLNSVMSTATEATEHANAQDALSAGVRGATAMLADEIAQGAPAAAVEVAVDDASGRRLLRVAVSLSVAPLVLD